MNNHSYAITIDRTVFGCSCLKATTSKSELRPGEESSIEVEWQAGRKRNQTLDNLIIQYHETSPSVKSKSLNKQMHKRVALLANCLPDTTVNPTEIIPDESKDSEVAIVLTPGVKSIVPEIKNVYPCINGMKYTIHNDTRTIVFTVPAKNTFYK